MERNRLINSEMHMYLHIVTQINKLYFGRELLGVENRVGLMTILLKIRPKTSILAGSIRRQHKRLPSLLFLKFQVKRKKKVYRNLSFSEDALCYYFLSSRYQKLVLILSTPWKMGTNTYNSDQYKSISTRLSVVNSTVFMIILGKNHIDLV